MLRGFREPWDILQDIRPVTTWVLSLINPDMRCMEAKKRRTVLTRGRQSSRFKGPASRVVTPDLNAGQLAIQQVPIRIYGTADPS